MMPDETAKVFCPYCGKPMLKYSNGYGAWWHECNCGAATPIVGNEEEARTVALNYHNRADIDEICTLRARVENLTLYLKENFELCPADLQMLNERHPGLPGYAPPTECQSCKIDDLNAKFAGNPQNRKIKHLLEAIEMMIRADERRKNNGSQD